MPRSRFAALHRATSVAVGMLGCVGFAGCSDSPDGQAPTRAERVAVTPAESEPRWVSFGGLTIWWEAIPEDVRRVSIETGDRSNIGPNDYAGPASCETCHQEQYDAWSRHPHRFMNLLADEGTVRGDFSGSASIDYLGGRASFSREGDDYRMTLTRGGVERQYDVNQTIGSRFFQYYVGRLIFGPEPPGHEFYEHDHVLPFGYWLDHEEWVPIVHVGDEHPEGERMDPFAPPSTDSQFYARYAASCNFCHTTFAIGDLFVRKTKMHGGLVPRPLHLTTSDYLETAHPELWDASRDAWELSDAGLQTLTETIRVLEAPDDAVSMGISCEACHLGAKAHAEKEAERPLFSPQSPCLRIESAEPVDTGRTHENVNWVCSRCHTGARPEFAAGMSTWNSTEHTDALKGSCYSELRCIDCHDPHTGTGTKWSRSPDWDDARCLHCHQQFDDPVAREAHTHHASGSAGDRCMNCHMPRINEGLQDIVRTHAIFSPNNREMLEANHPNACNLCHVDESIDWTLKYLSEWYTLDVSEDRITSAYGDRSAPVAVGWLKHEHESVRLVGADALTRTGAEWALEDLIDMLDDPFLINRQFVLMGLERMLNVQLSSFGYRFYMTREERREPIERLREAMLSQPDARSEPGDAGQ